MYGIGLSPPVMKNSMIFNFFLNFPYKRLEVRLMKFYLSILERGNIDSGDCCIILKINYNFPNNSALLDILFSRFIWSPGKEK